ncbi:MAG TPA: phospholipase domain-containing protein, partial [Thermomonospora sp.]|nr:phospholipase domain-containing protein [Thermomonospora sp.]
LVGVAREGDLDAFELVLTGPNGFRREFAGRPGGVAEVHSTPNPSDRDLWITLRNRGTAELTFQLVSLAYGDRRRQVTVRPGQSRTVHWHTRRGWYDLDIKVAEDPAFRRRLMGHIENGRPSISG